MNWLQKLIIGKELAAQLQQKAAPFAPGVRYELINGRLVTPVDNKQTYVDKGYSVNDIIFSVVNMITDKVRLPEWDLYKIVDEKSLKRANKQLRKKNITPKQFGDAMKLKDDSLEPISKFNLQAGKVKSLLDYPNEQCFQEFIRYAILFKLLTGDTYIWGDILKSGANGGVPNSLWVLPSQYMNIKVDDRSFPPIPASYELTIWNQKFTKESILHNKYPNPNWTYNGEQLYGFAPLRSFLKNTTRNNSAKDSSAAKFQNGGLDTVLYVDGSKLEGFTWQTGVAQANALKDKLATEYTGPVNQGKLAVSGYPVGATTLGLSPVDLGIIDSEKWDALMFCNGYGVPPELLGLTQKTYNNAKEAEKALTLRSAIPLLDSIGESLNHQFQTYWGLKGQNIYLDYSLDCFPELEADLSEMSRWLDTIIMITPDEQRQQYGMDALNTTESKEVWVKTNTGYVPLSDFQANAIDQQLMNDLINSNGTNGAASATNNGQANSANGNGKIPQNGAGKVLSY